jgi:hypothetical protein
VKTIFKKECDGGTHYAEETMHSFLAYPTSATLMKNNLFCLLSVHSQSEEVYFQQGMIKVQLLHPLTKTTNAFKFLLLMWSRHRCKAKRPALTQHG